MKARTRSLAVLLAFAVAAATPAHAGDRAAHSYIRPDVASSAGVAGGSGPAADVRPDTAISRPGNVGRDRALAPYYVAAAASKALDLVYTRKVIDTGRGAEANRVLVGAERLALAAGLPRHTGREIASGALAAGYCLAVRSLIYPRSPRTAKVALIVFVVLNLSLAVLNRDHYHVITARP
jgi:hypothetical protein